MANSTKSFDLSDCRVGFSPPIPKFLLLLCTCALVLFNIASPAYAKYGGGTGGPNDPYLIFDANQMNAIGANPNDWDKHFKLMADINLADYTGTQFNIIGNRTTKFTGLFDGSGHTISNFTYTSTGTNFIGLFTYVRGENAEIKNVGLIDPNVDAGIGGGVGSLVGSLSKGTVTNCYVEGGSISRGGSIGGLVGVNSWGSTISDCYSTASVSGSNLVGGLVGYNWRATITNCYASGDVSGTGWDVGGLVGENYRGTINNCYASGDVSGTTNIGGLVGENGGWVDVGTITSSYSTGSVMGDGAVGGLVGISDGWSHVSDSFWDIQTSGQTTSAGGAGKTTAELQTATTFIVWACEPVWTIDEGVDYPRLRWENMLGEPITTPSYGGGSGQPNDPYLIYTAEQLNEIGLFTCHFDKHFKLMADIDLAGFPGTAFNLIGYHVTWQDRKPFTGVFDGNGHTISNFTYTSTDTDYIGLFGYVSGGNAEIKDLGLIDPNVDAGTGRYVGSLVGELRNGTITGCYVQGGSVAGADGVGGMVGVNSYGTISNCYSTGSASGDDYVGGLVGYNSGPITNCYSEADVSGNGYVGGLVGYNWGTMTNCYATGSASGSGTEWWEGRVGGLVGGNGGTITNSYSNGSAFGNEYVGGLVGGNHEGTISNCYSTGSVTGTMYVGGLVGWNDDGTVTYSFWDIETSGQDWSDGGTGLPTVEMQTMSTFTNAGWDFTTPAWTIDEGVDYPRLWWELAPVLHAEPEVTLGTSNTITWDPVPGANDYYAECAEDANFTNILYNTGWITETSCEFTDLQLGQRYWYSVKARNIAGIETGWSNVESSLQVTLADAVDMMLDPDTLKNENMKNALLNKINEVLKMIADGLYADALNKLQNDILKKTDGCALTGKPDKNDWIITCQGQSEIYPLIIETIENVKGLMNQ